MKRHVLAAGEMFETEDWIGFAGYQQFVKHEEVQSHARTLLAMVEGMEHSELCPANYCIKPAITGDECCQIEHAHRRIPDHAF